jgi:3-oxoacyl-[acyl-carrier-protein] synthase II
LTHTNVPHTYALNDWIMSTGKAYIVDYDVISPLGIGKVGVMDSLKNNQPGEGIITQFSTENIPFKSSASVREDLSAFQNDQTTGICEAMKHDRKFELTVSSFKLMEHKLRLLCEKIDPSRKGIVMGVGADVPSYALIADEFVDIQNGKNNPFNRILGKPDRFHENIARAWNPYDIHSLYVAEQLELGAFQRTVLTACTSSTQAVIASIGPVLSGQCDLVVTGGTDSVINPLSLISFGKLGVLPESEGNLLKSCRPFDVSRNGTLAGEAAGFAVIVSENYLEKTGINPICQIVGHGNTLDAYKITAPDPSGQSMMKAISQAVASSGWSIDEFDYIHAHGTGTFQNDSVELEALKSVFDESLKNIPISSTKDRHGHAIAAAGIQELSIVLLCMQNRFIPGTMNLEEPIDPDLKLIKSNLNTNVDKVLMNNFAFGGINAALALKKCWT